MTESFYTPASTQTGGDIVTTSSIQPEGVARTSHTAAHLLGLSPCRCDGASMVMRQTVIDRTMQTYGMMNNLTLSEEASLRAQLTVFLDAQLQTEELALTVAGLKFLHSRTADMKTA